MSTNRIILGYPFSGALYFFFRNIRDKGYPYRTGHSYYDTLYGRSPHNWRTLTLTLLYPEIILTPQDDWLPRMNELRSPSDDDSYFNPELGLRVAGWNLELRNQIRQEVKEDLLDDNVKAILKNVRREYAREKILEDTRFDIHLAQEYDAPIFCAGGRRALTEYIVKKEIERRVPKTAEPAQVEFTSEYLKVNALLFDFDDLDKLYYAKNDPEVREYAASFTELLQVVPNQDLQPVEQSLEALMLNAIDKAAIANHARQRLETTADIFSTASLGLSFIPGASIFTTAIGMGSDQAAKKAERDVQRHQWYDFVPQVNKAATRFIMLQNLRNKGG